MSFEIDVNKFFRIVRCNDLNCESLPDLVEALEL